VTLELKREKKIKLLAKSHLKLVAQVLGICRKALYYSPKQQAKDEKLAD
jgi:hypothetical protein